MHRTKPSVACRFQEHCDCWEKDISCLAKACSFALNADPADAELSCVPVHVLKPPRFWCFENAVSHRGDRYVPTQALGVEMVAESRCCTELAFCFS